MEGKSILIVDDQSFVCKSLSKELQEGGFAADHALSGQEALKLAQGKKYDLFFVDISMPDMDGIETCRALKKISPDAQYVCFTGMYNRVLSRRNQDYVEANGKVKLLYKPFREDDFLGLAQKILVGKDN